MAKFLDVHCSLDNSKLLCLIPDVSRVRHNNNNNNNKTEFRKKSKGFTLTPVCFFQFIR